MEPGDFAVRGGIIDLFPPGNASPVRLDVFDQTPSQSAVLTPKPARKNNATKVFLFPAGEIHLNDEAVSRFRRGYTATSSRDRSRPALRGHRRGRAIRHGTLVAAVLRKTRYRLHHFGAGVYFTDPQTGNACQERAEQIRDYYTAREEAMHDNRGRAAR